MSTPAICILSILALCLSADTPDNPDLGAAVGAENLTRDLEEVRRIIDQEWMLADLTPTDYAAAIAAIRAKEGLTTAEFALELQRLLAMGADGHASSAWLYPAIRQISGRQLPFTLEAVGRRFAAIDPSSSRRNQLWRPEHPYVAAIDGLPIERWIAEATALVPRSHPLAARARAANLLRYAGYFRTRLGVRDSPTFTIEMHAVDGTPTFLVVDDSGTIRESLFKYNLFLHDQAPWRITAGKLGYLRLAGAPDELGRRLVEAMPKLRDTRGLVLDLRENEGGGGSELLNLLGIWLAGGECPRHVAGFIRSREGDPDSANTFAVVGDSPELSQAGRRTVAAALDRLHRRSEDPAKIATTDRCVLLAPPSVEPQIQPYSVPNFSRLVPADSIYHYDRPVVVLVDRHCFSSAELVAAGLQGMPNVTVVGERTRGGAGAPQFFRLPATGLEITLASRKCYLSPDGSPIDGLGVCPDVPIDLDLHTITGPDDPMLEQACREVEKAIAQRSCSAANTPRDDSR